MEDKDIDNVCGSNLGDIELENSRVFRPVSHVEMSSDSEGTMSLNSMGREVSMRVNMSLVDDGDSLVQATEDELFEQARIKLIHSQRLEDPILRTVYLTTCFGNIKELRESSRLVSGKNFLNDYYNAYGICKKVHLLRFAGKTDRIWSIVEDNGLLYHSIPEVLFKYGLRLPLHPFITDLFGALGCGLSQVVPNSHLHVLAFIARCYSLKISPDIAMFFSIYRVNMMKDPKTYYFSARRGRKSLVTTPNSHPFWKHDFLFISGPEFSVLGHWKLIPQKKLVAFNGREKYSEEQIMIVNGDETCFRHEQFLDKCFLVKHGLAGSTKQAIVGGEKSGKSLSNDLTDVILSQKPSDSSGRMVKKNVSSKQKAAELITDSGPVSSKDVKDGPSKGRELVQYKKREVNAGEQSNPKRIKLATPPKRSLGCTIQVGERERWFGPGMRPMQVFDGFDLPIDDPHYATKSPGELEYETEVFLARFVSNFRRMCRGFGHDPQARLNELQGQFDDFHDKVLAYEAKEVEWKNEKELLVKQMEDLTVEKNKLQDKLKSQKSRFENKINQVKKDSKDKGDKITALQKTVGGLEAEIINLMDCLGV